jgi:hypothetical protein
MRHMVPVAGDHGMICFKSCSKLKQPSFRIHGCPQDSDFCNPVQFTIMLLAWHLVAVVTVEAAAHCAFSLLAVSSLLAWPSRKKQSFNR